MNQLNVSTQQSIITLLERGWSQRRIARELRLDRSTVARYAVLAAKPATNLPHGSESETDPKPATNSTHGDPPGPASLCEQFAETIGAGVQAGLSAQRIYQDLVCEHGFQGSYCSVKRFVRRITQRYALPFRRLEDWGKLLQDVPTAGAVLDRFLHHATVIAITGESYRLKDAAVGKAKSK